MADITSLQNPKVKLCASLYDRRDRDKTGLFLIEGYREITRALKGGAAFETLFFCSELFLGENEPQLIEAIAAKKAQILSTTPDVFKKLSYRDRPDGLIAIAKQIPLTLSDIPLSKNPFLLVAQAIEKPGNLGTCLRSSDAVKVDGVIIADRCTDIHNPNVVRASVGTLFTQPVVEASTESTFRFLKENKIKIVATTPSAKLEFTEADLSGPIAIAVGTEQTGLSKTWFDQADILIRIPMKGEADSLNVATATTLVLYEALRQRNL